MMLDKAFYPSPLRYPGGKTCLFDEFKRVIQSNNLNGIHYAEPFAGGAGLALSLLRDGLVSHIYLNDLDSAVFAFWSSVLEETEELCRKITAAQVTVEEWLRQKAVLSYPREHSVLELGFATFFLNRTNRSGIIEGGMIGGKQQTGQYKLDCRFKKETLVRKIESVAMRKQDISLTRFDATEFILDVVMNNNRQCLVFMDPPYYNKGHELYFNSLDHNTHLRLSTIIQTELKHPWIVTYDDVPEIAAMYASSATRHYSVNYSVQTKRKGREVMYHSRDLIIPDYS